MTDTFEDPQVQVAAGIQAIARAFDKLTVTVEEATRSLVRLKRAMIEAGAHWQAGDWPDSFSVVNRYLRTGVLPNNITGERWEA